MARYWNFTEITVTQADFYGDARRRRNILSFRQLSRACNAGRGYKLLSVARGKVAEGIDFDRHYGRAVVMYVYLTNTRCLEFTKVDWSIYERRYKLKEQDFSRFDAIRVSVPMHLSSNSRPKVRLRIDGLCG